MKGVIIERKDTVPIVPAGAIVQHAVFGEGQVVALRASFQECSSEMVELPYLRGLPEEVSFYQDGKNLFHEKFGEGTILAYTVVFEKVIMHLSYPMAFQEAQLIID